jgi:hypothetical protein
VDSSVLPSTIELQARMYMLIATIMHAGIDSSGGREYAEGEKRREMTWSGIVVVHQVARSTKGFAFHHLVLA